MQQADHIRIFERKYCLKNGAWQRGKATVNELQNGRGLFGVSFDGTNNDHDRNRVLPISVEAMIL